MVLNTETSWSPNYYLYHRICLTINKIVYYQHLLVSFEELLSLRLSDHFALVVGCINNNWLNLVDTHTVQVNCAKQVYINWMSKHSKVNPRLNVRAWASTISYHSRWTWAMGTISSELITHTRTHQSWEIKSRGNWSIDRNRGFEIKEGN